MDLGRRSIVTYILFFAVCSAQAKNIVENNGKPAFLGPYDIHFSHVVSCQSDTKPQANASFFMNPRLDDEGHFFVSANLTLHEDIGPIMGRIRVARWADGKFKPALDYTHENVCDFFFLGKTEFLPIKVAHDSACIFKKAEYVLPEQNVDNTIRFMLGNSFFYGKFKIQFEWFSKTHLLLCTDGIMEFAPPPKKLSKA